ncbi:unnamed protein product, partial [Arabidopsis halleri]
WLGRSGREVLRVAVLVERKMNVSVCKREVDVSGYRTGQNLHVN